MEWIYQGMGRHQGRGSRGMKTGSMAMNQNRGRGRMNQQHGINRNIADISSRMNQDESFLEAWQLIRASDIKGRGSELACRLS
jgi:hypothetical protein